MLDESWDEILSIDNVNVCTEAFTLVMQYILNGMKMRIKQTCSPWSHDADITIAQHQRDWLHHSEDWARYRKSRNKVTALQNSSICQH